MKAKCSKCGDLVEKSELDYRDECPQCKRRRDDDDRRYTNMAMGDMLNTGIPGGLDMNILTPW
jgi:hypothetical protein